MLCRTGGFKAVKRRFQVLGGQFAVLIRNGEKLRKAFMIVCARFLYGRLSDFLYCVQVREHITVTAVTAGSDHNISAVLKIFQSDIYCR